MSANQIIRERVFNPRASWLLEQAQVHPLLAKLLASREVQNPDEISVDLDKLLPPQTLLGAHQAAILLYTAIKEDLSICIVADYDCDGATACAVAMRGLRMLGASKVTYLVPDRVVDGYGLTAEISKRVAATGAQILITVDNGIASVEGVRVAKELGLKVLITDHHLPGPEMPAADVVVNPNQPGCTFESKNLSGVGVIFYVLLSLRAFMRKCGEFKVNQSDPPFLQLSSPPAQPKLDTLLPLVALGSVADVVRLDANNRRLVEQGLRRIRGGQMPVGLKSLFEVCGVDPKSANTQVLGFSIGPRINAAGRLSDMTIGIECLLSESEQSSLKLAQQLHHINQERRLIESQMLEEAWSIAQLKILDQTNPISGEEPPNLEPLQSKTSQLALCVYDDHFHEGVVGIVASRIKERFHCPTFVFAPSQMQTEHGVVQIIKGSGRSVEGFHLRDALDLISKNCPGVLIKFGGHAMAAGCSLLKDNLSTFEASLCNVAKEWLGVSAGCKLILTDGSLPRDYLCLQTAALLQAQVWGQGFETPQFCDTVHVLRQRIVGGKHLSLRVRLHEQELDAIWFNHSESLASKVQLVYRLETDYWSGVPKLKLHIQAQV
jgi:single-stranded-DNA-specific exonuclease